MVLKKGNTLQSNTPNNHITLELRNLRHFYHSLIHLFMLFHTGYWTWPVGSRLTGTKHAGEGENDTQTLTVDAIKNQSCAKRWAFVHHFYLSDVHVCAMCLCVCVSPQPPGISKSCLARHQREWVWRCRSMASDLDQRRGLSLRYPEFLRNQSDVKNFLQKLRTYLLLRLHLLVHLRFRLQYTLLDAHLAHRQLAGLTFKTILQAVLLKNYFW